MKKENTLIKPCTETVSGIDLGYKQSHVCVLDVEEGCVKTGTVATTPNGFKGRFERIDARRIAMEAACRKGRREPCSSVGADGAEPGGE